MQLSHMLVPGAPCSALGLSDWMRLASGQEFRLAPQVGAFFLSGLYRIMLRPTLGRLPEVCKHGVNLRASEPVLTQV